MNEEVITFEIKNVRLVELSDLTTSMHAFAAEFVRFLEKSAPEVSANNVRLYVKEIRQGSIVAEIVPYAATMLPFLGYANTVFSFCKHMKTAYAWLSGESAEKPELERAELENLSQILEPIVKDRGAQLNIGTINAPNGNVFINLDTVKANAAQNSAKRELALIKAPTTGLHEKVVLYWYQARGGDPASRAGDRAIIESIYPRAVKTVFANDALKTSVLLSTENPFREAYVVDVVVETISNKAVLYKIVTLHDKFDKEEP